MQLKGVREHLKDRDELLETAPNSTETIKKSQEIRQELRSARENANSMREEIVKEKKKRIGRIDNAEMEKREEQLDLVWKHIEEVERLEKRRYNRGAAGAAPASSGQRNQLMNSGRSRVELEGAPAMDDFHPATNSDLPDFEVQEQLQEFRKRDQQLDQGLDELSQGVRGLKNVANAIGDELVVQTAMLDEIEEKVDGANQHLLSINRKMKDTLGKVKGADRFMMNFILLMVVLGIACYIYSMMK